MEKYEGMKYREVAVTEAGSFVNDPEWVMEQKMDGTRGMVVIDGGKIWWPGRGGRGVLAHTAATQHLPQINAHLVRIFGEEPFVVLDGEIMIGTGEYRVFDMPEFRFRGLTVTPDQPLYRRRAVLEGSARDTGTGPVSVVRQARTLEEKASMWRDIVAENVEGAMVKHREGLYEPGVRTKQALKLKLVKTAEVVVTKVTRPDPKHGTIEFGISRSPGVVRSIGKCSAIGKPHVEVGDVIEVAYLYWTGQTTYQPRMVRVRTDKTPDECTINQFKAYSRNTI